MNPNFMWMIVLLMILLIAGVCAMFFQIRKVMERYIKLEEWTEDWLKRMEQKIEHVEHKADFVNDMHTGICNRLIKLEELMPKDGGGEVIRNKILLQQMNDEMERGLRMEKEWNDGLSSILNYGKPITNEVKTNE